MTLNGHERDLDAVVELVLAGNNEAYAEIVERCELKVRVVLAAMLPDNSSVEDVAQEAFLTAYTKLDEYQMGTDFEGWLKEIARNYARNEMRKWQRLRKAKEGYRASIEGLIAPAMDAYADQVDTDTLRSLRVCIGQLKSLARSVVEAFYFERVSGREIAQRHEKTEGWVRLILFRAREAVAKCLSSKGVLKSVRR